jgi:predicted nucleic acid-binding protein
MKYLLDTCVISELIKKTPSKKVVKWVAGKNEEDLYLSVITLGELIKGITKLSDSKKKNELKKWFAELEERFSQRFVSINSKTALSWGTTQARLENAGNSIASIDGLIACTAIANGMTMVTRNVKDMEHSGVDILNPWE